MNTENSKMASKWSFFDDDSTSTDFVKVDSAEPLLEKNEDSVSKTICDVAVEMIREDRICKQKQNWPLVRLDDVKSLNRRLIGKPFGDFPMINYRDTRNSGIDYENDSWSLFDKSNSVHKRGFTYKTEINFLKKLFEKIPDGVILAGGFLVKFLLKLRNFPRTEIIDLDLFLVGDKPGETFVKIVRLIQDLFGDNIRWSRNKYVVNAVINNREMSPTVIQIVTKQFKSKDLVIGNFDIAASSVLFDGQHLLFTQMAALTYATRTIFVDTHRKSLAFEYRLQKYNKKGFNISFPELDLNSVKEEGYAYRLDKEFKIGKLRLRKNGKWYGGHKNPPPDDWDKQIFLRSSSIKGEEVSTYSGSFVNSKALINVLLKGTIDEKLYLTIDMDRDGNMSNYRISGNTDLKRLYAPLIPDIYEAPITHLRAWYNEKGFEALISTFTEQDDKKRVDLQREIRNEFVKQLQDRIRKISSTYGQQVEFFENIDPFRPDPVSGKEFYGELYKDVGLDKLN